MHRARTEDNVRAQITQFTYSAFGRVASILWADGSNVTYS